MKENNEVATVKRFRNPWLENLFHNQKLLSVDVLK